MTLNNKTVGKHIKEYRHRKCLSQAELSELVDKAPSYISYVETGKKQLSLEAFVEIANALEATADELLGSNLTTQHLARDEFSSVLDGCSTYERRLIVEMTKSLKQLLLDERRQRFRG